jgi:hypothetical protein
MPKPIQAGDKSTPGQSFVMIGSWERLRWWNEEIIHPRTWDISM